MSTNTYSQWKAVPDIDAVMFNHTKNIIFCQENNSILSLMIEIHT